MTRTILGELREAVQYLVGTAKDYVAEESELAIKDREMFSKVIEAVDKHCDETLPLLKV